MSFHFKQATKKQKKLRMALMGPSGSGKTFTSLTLATELAGGGRIAVIDTERGSASLYSDRFRFDTCELESYNPEHYIAAINAAAEAGYAALVIDSLSHAWSGEGGVLDQVSRRGGNSFTEGWGKVGTPLQNRLLNTILSAPLHVIATMRVKTEYAVEQVGSKAVPKRIGLAAVQRDGVEYEFDIIGVLDIQNTLTIEKTRMAELAGAIITKPSGSLARKILGWLSDGAPAETADKPSPSAAVAEPATEEQEHARLDGLIAQAIKSLNQLGVQPQWSPQRANEVALRDYKQPLKDLGLEQKRDFLEKRRGEWQTARAGLNQLAQGGGAPV